MGRSLATYVGFGIAFDEEKMDALVDERCDEGEDFYDWIDETLERYDELTVRVSAFGDDWAGAVVYIKSTVYTHWGAAPFGVGEASASPRDIAMLAAFAQDYDLDFSTAGVKVCINYG